MDFPNNFNPAEAEKKWYGQWLDKGFFRPEASKADAGHYSIVIPPPNVTGSLHMGHALNATIQDVLIRRQRMMGKRALWLPGTDHAGIATQNVVERKLAAEGADRHKLGREEFIRRVWKWKEESGGMIIHQLKRIGSSCDFSRERFTMDEGLSKAVREVFVRLYEEGLIYRATRLINWCPRCHTALSDLEVEHEEIDGMLTYIKYPLVEAKGHIIVATTRPETMLGDTAVAVNPEDERYKSYIGRLLELPLTGRKIPVIADSAVDPAFGTGAVKVTPAHDFNDEAMAKRQSPPLPDITVIGEDGRMTREAGQRFYGLDRYEARRKVVEELNKEGLITKEDKHRHAVGHCYRCKTIIEPNSTPQWYVRTEPLAKRAIEAVRSGEIRLVPDMWNNSYYAWMENIKDWCITRQIWWGHRVPVWYCEDCGEIVVSRTDPSECTKCKGKNLRQDTDVLDTWFSSALWPFSTLGWPDDTADLREFYPTSVLVTAFDILFFWVARMIMMGLKFMDGRVPFKDVYIHAIVRDAEGQKMSKSKGNVIDPLILIDKYGADAFRFTLAMFAAQGRDIRFSEDRVLGYKNFINKLWNAERFIMMNLEGAQYKMPAVSELSARVQAHRKTGTLSTRWILSRLAFAVDEANRALDDYRLNDAANAVYSFIWYEFCDWHIEMSKAEMTDEARDCLLYSLETALRLLHPFMPFLTEELWQLLPMAKDSESIMIAQYPVDLKRDASSEAECAFVIDAITGIRNIRGEHNISPGEVLDVLIKTNSDAALESLSANIHLITKLSRSKMLEIGPAVVKPANAYTSVKEGLEVYIRPSELDMKAELERLQKELNKAEESIAGIDKKLRNPDFMERAPKQVVDKEQAKHAELSGKIGKIRESISRLKA